MSCESCYNGCVDIVSDECVKYTGNPYASLGINYGDSLHQVELALINATLASMNGSGINITLTPTVLCEYIHTFLPAFGNTFNVVQYITAIVKAVCDLHTSVVNINSTLNTLNSDYTIGCLSGVTASSDTHDIVQAIITKLCLTKDELDSLSLDVNTNYVKLADLNTLIAAYIASASGGVSDQQYLKMVPYTAVEYYGPIDVFDGTGAGISTLGWYKVYLCNGQNSTPDKRGRVGVGAIKNVPGGSLDDAVNPLFAGNPNYDVYDVGGANSVALNTSQIPAHTHAATTVSTAAPHTHTLPQTYGEGGNAGHIASGGTSPEAPMVDLTGPTTVNITSSTTVEATGNGLAHTNIQPVLACNYIMYIP